jgi:predicted nucleotidyltransferase component of viral defense system
MPHEALLLHEHNDFRPLLDTVAQAEKIDDPVLVEKDYWIMHVLFGLRQLGLDFQLKGGTSLSKGFQIIHRFSEDIDIKIEPFDGVEVDVNPNHDKPAHIESRRRFFEKLCTKLVIPGITSVERDTAYDDPRLQNAGIRLLYRSIYGPKEGLKAGILLEAGFSKTSPNQAVTISSWAYNFAEKNRVACHDNRAVDVICYNPEYTFVEKLQTIARKFRQFAESGSMPTNFLRHYYDVAQLLDVERVQKFIGTPEYLEHKKVWFRSENQNLQATDAFTLLDAKNRELFTKEYAKTEALYYRGQIALDTILDRIKRDLDRL